MQLSPIVKAFLQALNFEGIEYLLVGGFAVRYHGYARPTSDVDIWTGTSVENAQKINRMIRSWMGRKSNLSTELFKHPNRIIRITFPPSQIEILDPIIGQKPILLDQFQAESRGQIEILTVQNGLGFNECYADRITDQIDGVLVNIISLQDLKKIKRAGDRPKDCEDLAHLP